MAFSLTSSLQKSYNNNNMAGIAQLVRAPVCGTGGRRFDPGCSPHIFLKVFLTLFLALSINAAKAEKQESVPVKPINWEKQIFSQFINKENFHKQVTEKPALTIIIDGFMAFQNLSHEILKSLPQKIILSIPAHIAINQDLLEIAIKNNYTMALSIDYLTFDQWHKMQASVERYPWVRGVIVWSISQDLETTKILLEMKQWLELRGIWLMYADTMNFIRPDQIPKDIAIPTAFIDYLDEENQSEIQAKYCLQQAKYTGRGIYILKMADQHLKPFKNWFFSNSKQFTLDNWSEIKKQ